MLRRRICGAGRNADAPITSGESRRHMSWLWYTRGLVPGEDGAGSGPHGATLTEEMNKGIYIYFGSLF